MNLFPRLIGVFIKVGFLTIGGGLAMIPILQAEIVSRNWLSMEEFLNIIGIAEMTPGPISINTATFVGYRIIQTEHLTSILLPCLGSLAATIAIALPSLFCINTLGSFWQKHKEHPLMVTIFKTLRPLVTGLVAFAAISLTCNCLKGDGQSLDMKGILPIVIFAISFFCTGFTKVSPFFLLIGGMVLGCLLL